MARTYLPTLIRILHHLCHYIVRYRDVIITHLGEGQIVMLDAIVTACTIFTDNVTVPSGD